MKILITESQYKTLINEQKVYASQTEYDVAIKKYTTLLNLYNESQNIYHDMIFAKIPITYVIQTDKDGKKFWGTSIDNLHNNPTYIKLYNRSNKLREKAELLKKDGLKIDNKCTLWFGVNFDVLNVPIPPNKPKEKFYKKNPVFYSSSKNYGSGDEHHSEFSPDFWMYFPFIKKPIKPILQIPAPIKTSPTITTTQQVDNKQTTDTKIRTNPITNFSVSWREDTPSGEVNQNTHYFPNYNEWKEFVTQYPHFSSKNENGSKTEAQALYSGLHADISKDKKVKGPQ